MREPFPKDLLMEAWNARHGYSFDNNRTQAAYLPLARDRYNASNDKCIVGDVCFKTKKTATGQGRHGRRADFNSEIHGSSHGNPKTESTYPKTQGPRTSRMAVCSAQCLTDDLYSCTIVRGGILT